MFKQPHSWSLFAAFALLVGLGWVLRVNEVHALPSFAAQTGQPCSACHVGAFGPQLTPLGRAFKIGGYTQQGGQGILSQIPLAGFALGSFTHTNASPPTPSANDFNTNNNPTLDQVSVFFAGRVTDNLGAFVQGTYDGVNKAFLLDNTDIRVTAPIDFGQSDLQLGISVNNAPTVQDPYNSTYAWMFPFASSRVAPTPAAQPAARGRAAGKHNWGNGVRLVRPAHLYGSRPL